MTTSVRPTGPVRRSTTPRASGTPVIVDCLHRMVESQVERTPDAEAVRHGDRSLTYRQLDEAANRLARALLARGVAGQDRVGVCLTRDVDLVVALLAVLKAGAAYVPLDPAYPPARVAFMTEDSGARVVLTRSGLADRFGDAALPLDAIDLADQPAGRPDAAADPSDLAYVIYTSGSTGRPKGVAVEHRSASVLMHWARSAFADEELGGMLAATSVCFDLSIFEIFGPLCWGGRVVLVDTVLALAAPDAARLPVTLVNTVPSAMSELLAADALPAGVRTVCLAGEPLTAALAARVLARPGVRRLLNLYGPSEDTTYSTWAEITADGTAPPIGRPLPHTRTYVLDAGGVPVPSGAPGELYLAGAGLARGYLGRPEETAARFLDDPFRPGDRMYRTGDRVRLRPDGQLEFLGRLDDQVKLRGHRIELGEVGAALAALPGVREAAAAVRTGPSGDPVLVGYLVGRRRDDVPARLRERLPAPMVPTAVVWLDRMPTTPSGKTDRAALPAPAWADPDVAPPSPGRDPAGARTGEVAAVWRDVLGVPVTGSAADFFDLGGDSLLAVRCAARLTAVTGVPVPPAALFDHPTVAALAAHLAARPPASRRPADAGERPVSTRARPAGDGPATGPTTAAGRAAAGSAAAAGDGPAAGPTGDTDAPLSAAQRRLWFLHQLDPTDTSYLVSYVVELRGPVDRAALARALRRVVARHPALRTVFPGSAAGPVQRVHDDPQVELVIEVPQPGMPLAERVARIAATSARIPMDLAAGPLLRAHLVGDGRRRFALLLVAHHIVCDDWSFSVLVRDLGRCYDSEREAAVRVTRPRPPWPAHPAPGPAGFALAQRDWLAGPAGRRALDEVVAGLRGAPTLLALAAGPATPDAGQPTAGRGAGALDRPDGASLRVPVDPATADAVRRLARAHRASLYMVGLAAFATLLGVGTGRTDLLVGTAFAGRTSVPAEESIGCFVNTMPLRLRPAPGRSFADLLAEARDAALAAAARQDVPFDAVVERLRPARHPRRNPLVQVAFGVQNAPAATWTGSWGLDFAGVELAPDAARLDLTLWLDERRGGLEALWTYRTDLFDGGRVTAWHRRFTEVLRRAATDPQRRLAECVDDPWGNER
ncbi:Linear gramicidin synthase subunit B [Micromonospora sp. MW-13]|uniref:non-ribosomal peptide synthetase n=1 Tax=Micromonospora sp. MW-13 TaxID=2094022 RepID=UPI000E435FB4|nr:non-ribosomal peptide synthetase [Micromonospora sp. MW-13]RGC67748.1 Linear gramicidin synthase subunit B [Micromonospora sp. MW-13]